MKPHTWNARKLREALVPLQGKIIRDIPSFVQSRLDSKPNRRTVMAHAFREALSR